MKRSKRSDSFTSASFVVNILFCICLIFIVRVFYLCLNIIWGRAKRANSKRTKPAKTLICIGSGGHTTEMLLLVEKLDPKLYSPRIYIIASTDTTSLDKVQETEKKINASNNSTSFEIKTIPRSRVVHQSYFTSIFTTLYATIHSIFVVFKVNPDLILCNGPGTCVPVCFAGFAMKTFLFKSLRIVFIESICRVNTLSLSGKIVFFICDNFVIQWIKLKKLATTADYFGKLF